MQKGLIKLYKKLGSCLDDHLTLIGLVSWSLSRYNEALEPETFYKFIKGKVHFLKERERTHMSAS